MKYNISSVEDLQIIQNAILNNEEVSIGDIKPIHYKLKLDGGRFKDYDPKYIDKFVARTILSQQANYEKMLKVIEKQYNVKIPDDKKLLKFELEKGSLELLTDLLGLVEVFKTMESLHQLYAVLGIAGSWFSYMGFSKFIELKKSELESKSKEKIEELSTDEQKRYLETINKSLEAVQDIANNLTLQKAINTPKQDLASMLEDGEMLTINDNNTHKITHNSITEFTVVPPVVDDIEEEVEDIYTISTYYFRSKEKYFKLDGITINANSLTMPALKRMEIITKAEELKPVKLKLKIIKDGLTKKFKEVFILDYLDS